MKWNIYNVMHCRTMKWNIYNVMLCKTMNKTKQRERIRPKNEPIIKPRNQAKI